MRKHLSLLVMGILLICSCKTPNVAYFSDMDHGTSLNTVSPLDIKFREGDKLSIVVTSPNNQLSALFNLAYVSSRISSSQTTGSGNNIMAYTIDSKGEIDFPVLGKLHVAGMRREEVALMVKNELMKRDLVKDPIVTVDYAGLYVAVLGEVSRPGRFNFDRDQFTLLDAISMAGDLTINGKRENVAVIRKEGNKRTTYRVNLLAGADLYSSPVYYLQQDDVIYVEPTNKRANESTLNNNLLQTPTFWMSVTTFLMSLSIFIFK